NRLLPAPLDRRNHSLFRVRLLVLSPSRHRIAADEHRNRRRPDADGKAPCVAPIVLGLLQDKPLLAFVQKLHRELLRDLRHRGVEHPFGALARGGGCFRRLLGHAQRLLTGLNHEANPAELSLPRRSRALQKRLDVAKNRKVRPTALPDCGQQRADEPAFERVDMNAPVRRRSLDFPNMILEFEIARPFLGLAFALVHHLGFPVYSAAADPRTGPLRSVLSGSPLSGSHSAGMRRTISGNSLVHHLRTRGLSKSTRLRPSAPTLPFIASSNASPRSVTAPMQARRGISTIRAPLVSDRVIVSWSLICWNAKSSDRPDRTSPPFMTISVASGANRSSCSNRSR